MDFIRLSVSESIATVTLSRPKVNALNEPLINELNECFQKLGNDSGVKSVTLTGEGRFFSFGLDVPESLGYTKESFTKFFAKFTDLYASIFLFSKPVVAALNGHTIGGGCILALACDCRLMVSGKAKISLNEMTFGSTVPAGCVEMLKFCVGGKNAETVLYTGAMYSAEEAKELGLIHEVVSKENLEEAARKVADDFAKKDSRAFQSVKTLLRKQAAEEIRKGEKNSVIEFVDIWYSENTRSNLEKIKIRD